MRKICSDRTTSAAGFTFRRIVFSPETCRGEMAVDITQTETSTARPAWLSLTWEKVATVLAIIGLADLSSQLIKWAALIHWAVTKYAIVRAWLFGWLPFHVPPEWHDYIVLFSILLSVTNVGVYRETGASFRSFLIAVGKFPAAFGFILVASIGASFYIAFHIDPHSTVIYLYDAFVTYGIGQVIPIILTIVLGVLVVPVSMVILWLIFFFFGMAFLVAWRWLLVTVAIFSALVIVNQVYVLWLEPLTAQ
jgi:hypothetical protein